MKDEARVDVLNSLGNKSAFQTRRRGILRKASRKKGFPSVVRGLQIILLASIIVMLVVFWPKLLSWLNQPIARVEVHGSFDFFQQRDVKVLLKPYLHRRFFQFDLDAVRERLLLEPWISEVSAKKRWPDRLLITLEEKEPVARWHQKQLITAEGEVFLPLDITGFVKLPVLDGPESYAQEIMQQYLAISQLLRPLGLMVSSLELSTTGSWRFNIGSVEVNIGRDHRMERLQRLVRLYHARLEPKWSRVRRIDLRYVNGASVAWASD